MKRLLTTLVILTGLFGSAGMVWADAESDYDKGEAADNARDYAEALKWLRKAAEQGHAQAQNDLGALYGEGRGVLQDLILAHMWFNIAAANGSRQGIGNRTIATKMLTAEQLEKAKERAKRCMASNYKECDAKAKSWWQKLTD